MGSFAFTSKREFVLIFVHKSWAMEILNYQVKASELDERFLLALKSLYKDAEITISVKRLIKVVEPTQTLSEMVAERDSDRVEYSVPGAVFSRLADRFLDDEEFDIAGEIENYKVDFEDKIQV